MQSSSPAEAHLYIEVGDRKRSDISICVGGYVRVFLLAPLEVVAVEHDGKCDGIGSADTRALWNKWVFLVSI